MTRLISFMLLMMPTVAFSETYLCLSEKGAVVTYNHKGAVSSQVANVANRKYILTNESGSWQVKGVPSGEVIFYLCDEHGMLCRKSETSLDYFNHLGFTNGGDVFVAHHSIFTSEGKGKNAENLTIDDVRIIKLTESGACTKVN
ncbi:hypothetical protein [Marinobacter sp.]|uniref:hypothetical protein n=1 Tax=Marinobacter sp. TaxID=50741 RepID=UPI003A8CE452